jgi:hypothetical protein
VVPSIGVNAGSKVDGGGDWNRDSDSQAAYAATRRCLPFVYKLLGRQETVRLLLLALPRVRNNSYDHARRI